MVTSAVKNNATGSPAEQSWEPAQATITAQHNAIYTPDKQWAQL